MAAKLIFLLSALLFTTTTILAAAPSPKFTIQGRVYCDTCRAGFETSATEYIEGAKVKLQCRHFQNETVMHTVDGVTNATGTYTMVLDGDHEEEICEVYLVSSPLSGCSETKEDRDHAHVLLTRDSGLHGDVRYANSLGFLKAEPLKICGELLRQYGLGNEL